MEKLIYILLFAFFASCANGGQEKVTTPNAEQVKKTEFNADSCYNYLAKQVAFGPRVPNTIAHKQCAKYLVSTLAEFADTVITQDVNLTAFGGTKLESRNIIASWNTASKNRIMLCAHWDSRPFCDEDANPANHKTPVLGANDGASGVAVLMELARQFAVKQPNVAVDIVLFDSEDYGSSDVENSYCLGSQYWARNPHTPNYRARFGILLDMVGGVGARFDKDVVSMHFASDVVNGVWKAAADLGYAGLFSNAAGGSLIDDHYYVNMLSGIPCIDIIDYSNEEGFPSTWHTASDNLENIDKTVLNAVGRVLSNYIYNLK